MSYLFTVPKYTVVKTGKGIYQIKSMLFITSANMTSDEANDISIAVLPLFFTIQNLFNPSNLVLFKPHISEHAHIVCNL